MIKKIEIERFSLTTSSDERFLAIAEMGDGTFFDELRKRHGAKLFRVAHRITRHREDAEDAVQESFLNAYIHLNGFDGRATLSTWLTRITINSALMKLRKSRRSRELSLASAAEGSELCQEDKIQRSFAESRGTLRERGAQGHRTKRDSKVATNPSQSHRASSVAGMSHE